MLHNPNQLYTGGAERFNAEPYVQFQANLYAKRQAARDAIDRHFADLNSKVTSTGMREQEVPALIQARNNYQKHYTNNIENIRNPTKDGGKAYMEAQRLAGEMKSITDFSKSANGTSVATMKIREANPDLADRWDENTVKAIADHEEPIYVVGEGGQLVLNEKHKQLDVNDIAYNPKTMGVKEWQTYHQKLWKSVDPDKHISNVKNNPNDPYSEIVTTEAVYSPEKLKAIGDIAKEDYLKDKSLRYNFEKNHNLINTPINQWADEHKSDFNNLNGIYKNVYGADIETPADLHAATALAQKEQPTITEKRVADYDARKGRELADRKEMARFNNALSVGSQKEMVEFKQKFKDATDEVKAKSIELAIDDLVETGDTKVPQGIVQGEIRRSNIAGILPSEMGLDKLKKLKAGAPLLDALSRPVVVSGNDKGTVHKTIKVPPTAIYSLPNGNFLVVDDYDQEGHEVSREELKSGYTKVFNTPAKIGQIGKGAPTPVKAGTPAQGSTTIKTSKSVKHPLPKGQANTVKQNGYTYTWNPETGQYE